MTSELPDAPLYRTVTGAGEAVLLINGIAMTASAWEPVARRLAGRYRVVRCDLRGQLMSPGPPPSDVAGHVDDVVGVLDELSIPSAHVVATSFGAIVATLLAATYPERVRSMVLVAAADRFDAGMLAEAERWGAACQTALRSGDKGFVADVIHPVAFSDAYRRQHRDALAARREQMHGLPDRWFADLEALIASATSADLDAALPRVRCSVLVLACENDGFIPVARSRGLASAMPSATFDVIPASGHAAVIEAPAEVARRTMDFLGRLAEGP